MKKNLFVFVALILVAVGVAACNDGGDVSQTKYKRETQLGSTKVMDMSGVPIFDNFEDLFSYMIFPCETGTGSAQKYLDKKGFRRDAGDNSQKQEYLRCFYYQGSKAYAIHTCGLLVSCRVRFNGINECGTELYNMKKAVITPDQDDSYSQGDEQIKKVCSALFPSQANIFRAPHLAHDVEALHSGENFQDTDTTEDTSEDEDTDEENQNDENDDQKNDHSDVDPE